MEIKKDIVFEIVKEERTYRFEIPEGSPLGETYQAGWEFLEKILSLINEHTENAKPKEPEEEKEEKKEDVS